MTSAADIWPSLPLEAWRDTHETLHLYLQIAGKVRLRQTPWVNHSWHVALYVTPRGLATSTVSHGTRTFEIAFDFIDHRLRITASDGATGGFSLEPRSVAAFYGLMMGELERLGLPVAIYRTPSEIADAIPFDRDETHRAYDAEYANRYWRVLAQTERVFKTFRARFRGKCSPVHYFWGAPDLAVTRFSGRAAPKHPGGVPNLPDRVAQEAYSHEEMSCGFWAGGGPLPYAAFYSYIYPEPPSYAQAKVKPDAAAYNTDLREFILPYDAVRESASPDATLLEFAQSTYEVGASLGTWDRAALDFIAPA